MIALARLWDEVEVIITADYPVRCQTMIHGFEKRPIGNCQGEKIRVRNLAASLQLIPMHPAAIQEANIIGNERVEGFARQELEPLRDTGG